MKFNEFKKYNNITGWLLFIVSALVYLFTMESSASFWDCGEFIAACYKMQIVHPPGAPMFTMIGRIFTLFAFDNAEVIPLMMNGMSALCSGFAMLFLFWVITHFLKRIFLNAEGDEIDKTTAFAILASGFIGALIGTFCDSIWFSAVEAEVYSMSLFFTALVVWLMTKWDEKADEPYADRFLILILFLMGVSIGVHWLNLLTIPALGYIYYFRRYQPSLGGMALTGVISFVLLGFIMRVVIVGFAEIATVFELTFVNSFGLPFNSGVLTFLILFFSGLAATLWFLRKRNYVMLFNMVLGLVMMLIGFSSIGVTVIRANADTPINMNAPQDMPSLSSFLKREQYGSRPFLNGQWYYSKVVDINTTGKIYNKENGKYKVVGKKFEYVYDRNQTTFFPRMHAPEHARRYENWVGLRKGQRPSWGQNFNFFVKYQLRWMYFRYMFWNFVGRQNDLQGLGGIKEGNWMSGIGFVDENMVNFGGLGNMDKLPEHRKNNPGHNKYYFIPLLLCLIGAVYHFMKDNKRAFAVFVLFFCTGILLIIYGNSPPVEPRERDYIFAASFWAFSIWGGIGLMALFRLLQRFISGAALPVAIILSAFAPILMGSQGWDDHNRNGRKVARDFAQNYLESCEPNAILFTQGDNDTYPLWYAQEVEGIRPDIRIVNLSLLGVDWYINQMRKANNSATAVDFFMSKDKYKGDTRNFVSYSENTKIAPEGKHIKLKDIVNFISSDNPAYQLRTQSGDRRNYFPTKNVSIPINKNQIIRNKVVDKGDQDLIVDRMEWSIPKRNLLKNDMMTLDIVAKNAENGWKRPVYFAVSINPDSFLGMQKYFQLEGFTYRLVPVDAGEQGGYTGRINTDKMYDNLLNDFKFGGLDDPNTTTDETIRRMISNLRGNYARLASKLVEKGQKDKAIRVLDYGLKNMPNENNPWDFYTLFAVEAYFEAGVPEKAIGIADIISNNLLQDLAYVKSLKAKHRKAFERDRGLADMGMSKMISLAQKNGQEEWAKTMRAKLNAVK